MSRFKCEVEGCDKSKEFGNAPYCKSHDSYFRRNGTFNRICVECKEEFIYQSRQINGDQCCKDCYPMRKAFGSRVSTLSHYSMTVTNYYEIFNSQEGKCRLCSYAPEFQIKGFGLVIDHDHNCCPVDYKKSYNPNACGKCIRALLCVNCNVMIGHYERVKGNLTIPEFDKYLAEPHFIFSR